MSKLIIDPETAEIHEKWINLIALASDPAEPKQEIVMPVAVDSSTVAATAREFDALQVSSTDGEETEVRMQVQLHAVCCCRQDLGRAL